MWHPRNMRRMTRSTQHATRRDRDGRVLPVLEPSIGYSDGCRRAALHHCTCPRSAPLRVARVAVLGSELRLADAAEARDAQRRVRPAGGHQYGIL